MKKVTINITMKVPEGVVTSLENYYNDHEHCELVGFKIIPNTEKLYESDATFKKLVKEVRKAQELRDIYINEYNN